MGRHTKEANAKESSRGAPFGLTAEKNTYRYFGDAGYKAEVGTDIRALPIEAGHGARYGGSHIFFSLQASQKQTKQT
ncbi:MAG: hypothetical protein KH037_04745 [Burkholderiales bacterium]|nr:hypothetical protein [Burkholderiales bacterium]